MLFDRHYEHQNYDCVLEIFWVRTTSQKCRENRYICTGMLTEATTAIKVIKIKLNYLLFPGLYHKAHITQ